MTIIADHPLNGAAFAHIAESEHEASAAWARRAAAVSSFVEECQQAGVELLRVPLSYAPRDGVVGARHFVVKQLEKRGGSLRYYVTAERSSLWGALPVGNGTHPADDGDEPTSGYEHFNLGEHVFVGALDGNAILAPAAPAERGLSAGPFSSCPALSWCTEDHSAPHTDMSFHIAADKREAGPGVLPTDIVLDGDILTVEVCDTIDWRVPMEEAPQFIAALRDEVERLEARIKEFVASNSEARGAAA